MGMFVEWKITVYLYRQYLPSPTQYYHQQLEFPACDKFRHISAISWFDYYLQLLYHVVS
jgi:hypothetical protein